MMRWRTWSVAALIVLLLALGTGLRCTGLQNDGLWPDELYSADLILNRPLIPPASTPWLERSAVGENGEAKSFWTVKAYDQSPPLFELAGKAITTLLGRSEMALRMTSVLAGVLFLLWVAMRAWRYRDDAAGIVYLCVLGLAASSGPLVYYAKEARVYSLGVALCGVLTVKFWERWRQGWRTAPLPGWGEAWLFAAVAWAHYSALALVAPMWLAYAGEALRRRKTSAGTKLAVMPIVLLIWLALSWRGFHETAQGHAGWVAPGRYGQVLESLIVHGLSHDLVLLYGWPGWTWLLVLLATGLCWWKIQRDSVADLFPHERAAAGLIHASAAALLLCAIFLPLAAAIVTVSRIENPHHLLFMLPALYLGVGSLLAVVRLRWRALAWLLLALLMGAQYPLLQRNLTLGKPVDIRSPSIFVRTHLQADDPVLIFAFNNPGAMRYYLPGWHLVSFDSNADTTCREMVHVPRFGVVTEASQELTLRHACDADYDIESITTASTFAFTGAVWRRKPSVPAPLAQSTQSVP